MHKGFKDLTGEQRTAAVQRLTALWAFTESGLGGVMHAVQIPFTGLVVGGMAVIIISLMAEIAAHDKKQILKAAVIVLIVKAMISPHTPFPAYIAVSFQALLGYIVFSLLSVNFFSIVLVSTIAMLESAIQKLLVLTLFFGKSFWKAMDEMIAFIVKQFGITSGNGSQWLVGTYLAIYLAGGILIAWIAYKTINDFFTEKKMQVATSIKAMNEEIYTGNAIKRKTLYQKLWMMILVLAILSVILFVFAADTKQGWLAVAKTVSWTLSAILVWFMLIGPLFTKFIQKLLQKKQSRYSDEVLKTLAFLPMLRRFTALAWQKSKDHRGPARWRFFISALVHWSLTCSDPTKKA